MEHPRTTLLICAYVVELIGHAHGDNPKLEFFRLIGIQAYLE